jgi:hypothetical protein
MTTSDISPPVQTCAATWDALAGTGDLLIQGQLQQAWSTLSSVVVTCLNQAVTTVQSALLILG